jgi:hypothetical protein
MISWILQEGPTVFQDARARIELAYGSCFIHRLTDFEKFSVACIEGDIVPLPTYLDRHSLTAVHTWGLFLAGIPAANRSESLCLAAVQNHPRAILFSPHQTPTIVWTAVEADPHAIQFITEQTADLIEMAIRKEPGAVWLLRDRTPEMEVLAYTMRQCICI